jgi:hypothetical protein
MTDNLDLCTIFKPGDSVNNQFISLKLTDKQRVGLFELPFDKYMTK